MTWFETIAGNQRTCSRASAMSSVRMLGRADDALERVGVAAGLLGGRVRAVSMIHWMICGSASWMITPSPTRPATASARGP